MSQKCIQRGKSESAAVKGRIQAALSQIMDRVYGRPGFSGEMYLPLEMNRAVALVRALVFRAIDKQGDAIKAGQAALAHGIGALELKASLPHGTLGQIFYGLPLSPQSLQTAIRETNRLAELPKGWLGFRKGGPQRKIDVSDFRHDLKLREVLGSGLIYKDMEICGSEDAFRAKFCPSTFRKESPESKCLRSLGQVERFSEELGANGRASVRERLAELCAIFGLAVSAQKRGENNIRNASRSNKASNGHIKGNLRDLKQVNGAAKNHADLSSTTTQSSSISAGTLNN